MNSHNIKISKASNTIGAIIEGVKLNEELSKDTIQEIYNAFLKYQVIFFKDQNLTKNEQRNELIMLAYYLDFLFCGYLYFYLTC